MTSEEDVEGEMDGYDEKSLKKMQEENKKKAEAHNHDDHHDHEDGVYTVIESITDVTSGENIEFTVDEPHTSGDAK